MSRVMRIGAKHHDHQKQLAIRDENPKQPWAFRPECGKPEALGIQYRSGGGSGCGRPEHSLGSRASG